MAAHAPDRAALALPRPLRSAAPLAALALAALALDAAPGLPWVAGVVGAGFFAAAALVRAAQQARELQRGRARADRLILQGQERARPPAVVQWRAEELTGTRHRQLVEAAAQRTLQHASGGLLPSASPLNRCAVREHEELIRLLAARLGDERPVAARGVLLAQHVLGDPESPLYDVDAGEDLGAALRHVLHALEP